jgi:integrase
VTGFFDRAVERGIVRRHVATCASKTGGRCRCPERYVVRITVDGERLTSPTIYSIVEARAWRGRLQAGGKAQASKAAAGPTVGALFEQFVADARAGIAVNRSGRAYRPRAIDDYVTAWTKHARADLASRAIADVTRGDVQALLDKLARDGVGASRLQSVATGLRALWRWAGARDRCDPNALNGLRMLKVKAKPRTILSPAQVQTILAPLTGRALVGHALAAYTSARAQEVGGTTWADVDWRALEVRLAEDEDARKTPAAQRTVPILDPLFPILRAEWERVGKPVGRVPLIPGDTTPARRADEMRRAAADQWKSALVAQIGLHDLRHSFISWALAAGVPLPDVRNLAGHESGEALGAGGVTMDVYGHALPGYVDRARLTLNAWIAAQLAPAQAQNDDDATEVAE